MKLRALALLVGTGLFPWMAAAQETLLVQGYLKSLHTVSDIAGRAVNPAADLLLHQRTRVVWQAAPAWRVEAALRTRLFTGYSPRQRGFGESVAAAGNDRLDLSVLLEGDGTVFTSVADRAFVTWKKGPLEVRAGRQRINWGITSVWNPNDVFNTFVFTDVDYEERPGADALSAVWYSGELSGAEAAVKPEPGGRYTAALRLFGNVRGFDVQGLAGRYRDDWIAGGGFAGPAGGAAIKGEWTGFWPARGTAERTFSGALSVEQTFDGGWFAAAGGLYNQAAGRQGGSLFAARLSPRDLFPYRSAWMVMASRQAGERLQTGLAVLAAPQRGGLVFLQPDLQYNLAPNLDGSFFAQLLFLDRSGWSRSLSLLTARLKWSF